MASDGVGKKKGKNSKDAGKPYERPQNLLQRFSTTVKDFFVTSSWWNLAKADDGDSEAVVMDELLFEEEMDEAECPAAPPVNGPQTQRPSSYSAPLTQRPSSYAAPLTQRPYSTDSSVKATAGGIVVEYDGYQATFDSEICSGDQNQNLAPRDSGGSLSSISRPPLSSAAAAVGRSSTIPRSNAQPSTSTGTTSTSYYTSSSKRSAPPPSGEEDDSSGDSSEANNPFNAQPSGTIPPGRTIKKAVRRVNIRR